MDNKELLKLYHYTSIEAACKIINSGIFRATNVMYLNDESEMIEAYKKVEQYLNRLIIGENIEKIIKQIFKPFDWYKKNNFPIFTISFSTKEDDLNQWRAYGDNGKGCCLCFQLDIFIDNQKKLINQSINIINNKCIYNEDEISNCLLELEKRIFLSGQNCIPDIAKKMGKEIFTTFPFIKHVAYKDESEYRFLYYSEDNDILVKCNENGNPFIEINNNNYYEKILFGPCVREQDKNKIQYWLNKNQIDIPLEKSQIPYRG